jgi:hypothetical protein
LVACALRVLLPPPELACAAAPRAALHCFFAFPSQLFDRKWWMCRIWLGRLSASQQQDMEVMVYEMLRYTELRVESAIAAARGRLGRQRGQATVEYVALVTLVALVMFGVITALKTHKFAEGQQLALLLIKKIEEAVKQVRF